MKKPWYKTDLLPLILGFLLVTVIISSMALTDNIFFGWSQPQSIETAEKKPESKEVPAKKNILGKQKISRDEQKIKITAVYPQVLNPKITADFRTMVEKTAMDFLKQPAGTAKNPNTLDISYVVMLDNPEFLSVLFQKAFYTGKAHSNISYEAMNYNLNTGEKLELNDLFLPGVDFLQYLSQISRRDLNQLPLAAPFIIEDRTQPSEMNYKNFSFTDKGLVLTFEPYQVGTYSSGLPTVTIPYSELKAVMAPELISLFIKN